MSGKKQKTYWAVFENGKIAFRTLGSFGQLAVFDLKREAQWEGRDVRKVKIVEIKDPKK